MDFIFLFYLTYVRYCGLLKIRIKEGNLNKKIILCWKKLTILLHALQKASMQASNARSQPSKTKLSQIFCEIKLIFSEISNQEENFWKSLLKAIKKISDQKHRKKIDVYQIFLLPCPGLCHVKAHQVIKYFWTMA